MKIQYMRFYKIVISLFVLLLMMLSNSLWTHAADDQMNQNIYSSEIKSQSSLFFFDNSTKKLKVHLKNTGSMIWTNEKGVHLSYHWLDKQGNEVVHDGIRSNLPKEVSPGEEVDVIATVQAPLKAGQYQLKLDLVQENVTWFSEEKSGNDAIVNMKILDFKDFMIGLVVLIIMVLFGLIILIGKGIIKIPAYLKKTSSMVIVRIDILWFIVAIYIKILYFSKITGMLMTPNAKLVSLLLIAIIGVLIDFLRPSKKRFLIAILSNFILTLLIFSDILYLNYFNNVLSIPVLLYMSQVGSVGGSIKSLIHLKELYIFIDLLFGLVVILLPKRFMFITAKPRSFSIKAATTGVVCIILVISVFVNISTISKENPGIFVQRFSNSSLVQNLGILDYHVFDTYKFISMNLNKPVASDEEVNTMKAWYSDHTNVSKNSNFGIAKQKNVLVVQVEALQQFVIGLKVNNQEVTPNLNKLVKESMYYQNYFDETNQGRTSDGEFTSMTSLYPLGEGSVYFSYPQQNYESLPRVLKENGYTTFSGHAYDGQFWNRAAMHKHLGFDSSMFGTDFQPGENIGWGLSDKDFLEQSVNKIATLPQPFMSFLITLSNHHPYDGLPGQYKVFDENNNQNASDNILYRYLNTVHYTDMAFGAMIEQMKMNGLYDNTVLAIYGDHDSSIDIKDVASLVQTGTEGIDAAKMDKVPLIIHIPGYSKPATSDIPAGHLDLTPSLLYLLGIDPENHFFMGNNLFIDDPNRLVVFRNGSFADNSHYYLTYDGTAANSQCVALKINQNQPPQDCTANAEKALKRLEMSDLIIQSNLIPRLITDK